MLLYNLTVGELCRGRIITFRRYRDEGFSRFHGANRDDGFHKGFRRGHPGGRRF